MRTVIEAWLNELDNGRACELVTILAVEGTAPREPGCTMVIGQDGRILAGTVGGGSVEYEAVKKAALLFKEGQSGEAVFEHGSGIKNEADFYGAKVTLRFTYCGETMRTFLPSLREAFSADRGRLVVHPSGKIEFFAGSIPEETVKDGALCLYLPPKSRVLLFGAGHVAQALCPLLKTVGFSVTVCDERKELACRERFPQADGVLAAPFSEDIAELTGAGAEDFIVIMSATHRTDELILSRFADREYRYIGMLGSRRKAAAITGSLIEKGVPEARLKEVHVPIGLPIGARTPEEIALSVAAELVKVRSGAKPVADDR